MGNSERNISAELYELEPNVSVDISAQAFEELRVSLEKVEAMKQVVAESIVKAKQKNLKDHVETFRNLLRKLVVMEASLKEEQDRKDTAKLAFELDALEEECNREIAADEAILETPAVESRHTLTSIRYGIAAKLIGFGGVFACLLGCIIYLIFVQIDGMEVSFHWIWPILNGIGVVIFTVIGLALNRKALRYEDLAQKEEAELIAEEEKEAQKAAAEVFEIAAAAYTLELEAEKAGKKKDAAEGAEEKSKCKLACIKKLKKAKREGEPAEDKKKSKLMVTAIAAGAALAAVMLVGKGKRSKKKGKKAAKIHGVFFQIDN